MPEVIHSRVVKALLFIRREGGVEAGPYDLVQMAGLYRRKIIDGQTPTRLQGEDAWMPFSWQPQFSVVREMPADAVSSRVDELDETAANRDRPPIPLPSRATVLRIGGLFLGCGAVALGAYCIARLDAVTGTIFMYAGLGISLVAQCLIIAKMLDENYLTLAMVFFLPGGDIYYFISNFWKYFKLFSAKYGGLSMFIGAAAGLGR